MRTAIKLNKVNLWQDDDNKKYTPPDSNVLNKIRSAASHRKQPTKEVFNHELFGFPQSLSKCGIDLYHGSKSDLLKKFERFTVDNFEYANRKSAVVIDKAHLIYGKAFADLDTFADFAFTLYFQVKLIRQSFERWDLCFDRYNFDSLKTATRQQRGLGS